MFQHPVVTDDKIRWAAGMLGLPPRAFLGEGGDDPRAAVLKAMGSIDIAACPGSGKTTLLVAKLAILADGWKHPDRGVCVLSHTNTARYEIETRLGNTSVGRVLLTYPHFVGTIHGFVNEFLAIPWLRSKDIPIKRIDNEISWSKRWKSLPQNIRAGLERRHYRPSVLTIKKPDYDVGEISVGRQTPTYRAIGEACRKSTLEGYFCYDEMFVWAEELLGNTPELAGVIRRRFPLFFLDEAQDNSEAQSAILHRIFVKEPGVPSVRQRFGDANQAIYGILDGKGASSDPFPSTVEVKELPNSHRFGTGIAQLACTLEVESYTTGLVGQGPKPPLASGRPEGRHTIFLFDDGDAGKVLGSYAQLLIDTFSEQELRDGTFSAVGMVHNPREERDDNKFPSSVGDYWSQYDAKKSAWDSNKMSFIDYIGAGQAKAEAAGEVYPAVERIAEGVLRLTAILRDDSTFRRHRHLHRQVVRGLSERPDVLASYRTLVSAFGLERTPLSEDEWADHWRDLVAGIARAMAGDLSTQSESVEEFLSWTRPPASGPEPGHDARGGDNVFLFPHESPKVRIRVGSVHSVKGETHTATLVLETFWHEFNLKELLPWMSARRAGSEATGSRQPYRLRVNYVAMTRPTHLLCLAMKRSVLSDSDGHAFRQDLEARGWSVRSI